MLIIASSAVSAYTVDGDLSDWGVDLSAAHAGDDSAWHPDGWSVDYVIEDNIDPSLSGCDWTGYCARGYHTVTEEKMGRYLQPAGGEHYDIEALYFDDDSQYGYFGIVTSLPPEGYTDRWNRHVDPADLAIDLDNDPSTGHMGYEYGIKLTGANKGQICLHPRWTTGTSFPENGPAVMSCDGPESIVVGTASVSYQSTGIYDEGIENFIVEVAAPREALGNPKSKVLSNLHVTITCGNDVAEIGDYQWDHDVPEFGTLAALALLGGAGLYIHRKRK